MRITTQSIPLLLILLLCGCGKDTVLRNAPPQNQEICCFGDSLVFGSGADGPEDTYPAYLSAMTGREVHNWGTPGDTTEDALAKCDQFEPGQFGTIVVTIGGNDILRRINWAKTEQNLRQIFQRLQETGAVLVFTGVTGPLNPTRDKLYREICEETGVLYISEILDGITGNPDLLADTVHPNSRGYRIMADRVAAALRNSQLVSGE